MEPLNQNATAAVDLLGADVKIDQVGSSISSGLWICRSHLTRK